jgi:hypothetical protein
MRFGRSFGVRSANESAPIGPATFSVDSSRRPDDRNQNGRSDEDVAPPRRRELTFGFAWYFHTPPKEGPKPHSPSTKRRSFVLGLRLASERLPRGFREASERLPRGFRTTNQNHTPLHEGPKPDIRPRLASVWLPKGFRRASQGLPKDESKPHTSPRRDEAQRSAPFGLRLASKSLSKDESKNHTHSRRGVEGSGWSFIGLTKG